MNKPQPKLNVSWREPLELYHWEAGDPVACPVVLLVGLGMQAIEWPEPFLEALTETHRVIFVENRDAGKSPRCGQESEPEAADVWLRKDVEAAKKLAQYSLFEMRDDVLALLDRLKIGSFDLVGFSMGGMIGQLVAAAAGTRVGKFVQLGSNDGSGEIDGEKDSMQRIARLFTEPDDPARIRDYLLEDSLVYGAGKLTDGPELQAEIEKIHARGYSCGGSARHAMAVLSSPDRQHLLSSISARTLILHGDRDPCISPKRGRAAAGLIPNARFQLLPGVGHILDQDMCDAALKWLRSSEERFCADGEHHGVA